MMNEIWEAFLLGSALTASWIAVIGMILGGLG